MNAAKRNVGQAGIAKATGLMAGEPDMRVYMIGAVLGLIEFKRQGETTSDAQDDRHALLRSLGFSKIYVLVALTEEEAADKAESIVRHWLTEIGAAE